MLRTLIKNTAIYGLGDFVFKFIGFAVFPIYAHTFSVEEFGAMALVTTLAGLVGIFLNVGMNNSIQRFLLGPRDARGSSPGSGEHWPLAPLGFVNAPYWTRALGFVPSTHWYFPKIQCFVDFHPPVPDEQCSLRNPPIFPECSPIAFLFMAVYVGICLEESGRRLAWIILHTGIEEGTLGVLLGQFLGFDDRDPRRAMAYSQRSED